MGEIICLSEAFEGENCCMDGAATTKRHWIPDQVGDDGKGNRRNYGVLRFAQDDRSGTCSEWRRAGACFL